MSPLTSIFTDRLLFERPDLWPVAVCAAGVATAMCLRRYRAGPGGGRALAGLRLAALLLVSATFLAPAWRRPGRVDESGGIAVLLDTSLSMGVTDVQRPPGEQLRLARAMGLWTSAQTARFDEQSRLVTQYRLAIERVAEARRQVDAVELTRRDPRAARAGFLAACGQVGRLQTALASAEWITPALVRSMEALDLSDTAGASDWLARGQGLLASLADEHRRYVTAQLDRFALEDPDAAAAQAGVSQLSRLDVARALLSRDATGVLADLPRGTPVRYYAFDSDLRAVAPADLAALAPTGTRTDFAAVFAQFAGASTQRPRAVVVLSDGRDSAPAPPEVSPPDVPVFTVQVAPSVAPPAVRIVGSDLPASMVLGQSRRCRVMLRTTGLSTRVAVRIRIAGQTQVREVDVRPGSPDVADFDLSADRPGTLPIEISIDPREQAAPGPLQRLVYTVRVLPRRPRVLLCAARFTRDVQLLRQRLAQGDIVRLVEAPPSALAAELAAADMVVLCDVPASDLPPDTAAGLLDAIRDRGVSLLLLPGPGEPFVGWSQRPDLAALVPGASWSWRAPPSATGGVIAIPVEAPVRADSPLPPAPSFGTTADFADRPGLFRFIAVDAVTPQTTAWLADRDSSLPLLTSRPVGAGQICFVASDQLYRWNVDGDHGTSTFFDVLLARLVPRVAPVSDGGASLDVEPVGRTLYARVTLLAADGSPRPEPPPGLGPTLTLSRGGVSVARATAVRVGPGRFAARFPDLTEGDYEVRLLQTDELRQALRIGDAGAVELSDCSGSSAVLGPLAATTGAAAYRAEDLADPDAPLTPPLSRRLADLAAAPADPVLLRLWNHPAYLALILALLSLEWALRKHRGLL